MQDRVEGFCGVAGVKVASCVLTVSMEEEWHPPLDQVDEFRYDLCTALVDANRALSRCQGDTTHSLDTGLWSADWFVALAHLLDRT